jgi:hypothetical protein
MRQVEAIWESGLEMLVAEGNRECGRKGETDYAGTQWIILKIEVGLLRKSTIEKKERWAWWHRPLETENYEFNALPQNKRRRMREVRCEMDRRECGRT